jgi:hypothetical protein
MLGLVAQNRSGGDGSTPLAASVQQFVISTLHLQEAATMIATSAKASGNCRSLQ